VEDNADAAPKASDTEGGPSDPKKLKKAAEKSKKKQ
jgi:hypothetical protein